MSKIRYFAWELVVFFRDSALHVTIRALSTFKDIVYVFKIGLSC